MRWEDLFADLEAQLQSRQDLELADEASELAVAEASTTSWSRRLLGHVDREVDIGLVDGRRLRGRCLDVGPAWMVVHEGRRRALVPLGSVVWIEGLALVDPGAGGEAVSGLDLGHALRVLAEREELVTAVTAARDIVGVISRVGADYLEIALGPGATTVTVPFVALVVLLEEG